MDNTRISGWLVINGQEKASKVEIPEKTLKSLFESDLQNEFLLFLKKRQDGTIQHKIVARNSIAFVDLDSELQNIPF